MRLTREIFQFGEGWHMSRPLRRGEGGSGRIIRCPCGLCLGSGDEGVLMCPRLLWGWW